MQDHDLKKEFRALLKASKWTQAEAARQLAMTPGALSQIVRENSPVKPSRGTLRLFNLLVRPAASETCHVSPPGTLVACEKWEVELITALRKLTASSRAPLLKAFGTLIEANLPVQRKKGKPALPPLAEIKDAIHVL